jgi:putative peptidoglycan lipid II flippase
MIKAFFTNSTGILVSRILGFVRDLLTASILGANIFSDIFFVAFKLPNLFRRIFAEGAFSQAFIPSLSAARYKARFGFEILFWLLLVVFGLSVLVNLFSYTVTSIIAYGFDEETRLLTAPLVAINFYYLDFIFAVSFLAGMLHYKNHFATTAFSTALLNIAMIFALLIAQNMEKIEIVYWLSYGVLAGGALQLLTHLYAAKNRGICKTLIAGAKSEKDSSEDTGRFKKAFAPAIFASSASHVSAFLDTFLASFLISGSISYLYYANRILQLPLALFAIAVAVALFPAISRAINQQNTERAHALLRKSSWLLLYLLSFSTVGAMLLSEEIIWLLFERGAFLRSDTLETAWVLMMYMIGLLPFGLAKIFSLWHFANHNQKAVAKITALSLVFNILLSLALIVPFKAGGLALASSISGFVLFWLNYRLYVKASGVRIFWEKRLLWLVLSIIAFTLTIGLVKYVLHASGLVSL